MTLLDNRSPRTIELSYETNGFGYCVSVADGERCTLVELEPVLDLLEPVLRLAFSGAVTTDADVKAVEDAEAFLATHNRGQS